MNHSNQVDANADLGRVYADLVEGLRRRQRSVQAAIDELEASATASGVDTLMARSEADGYIDGLIWAVHLVEHFQDHHAGTEVPAGGSGGPAGGSDSTSRV